MQFRKKYVVILLLASMVGIAVAALPPPTHEFKNLKVLPENISSKELSRIMIDEFEDGLGVNCGFCHAEENNSHRLDYASDAKPEKQIARLMMKMTLGINRKYFKLKHPMIGDSALEITCITCHNRQPHPGDVDSQ
jgi:hypothetical protein